MSSTWRYQPRQGLCPCRGRRGKSSKDQVHVVASQGLSVCGLPEDTTFSEHQVGINWPSQVYPGRRWHPKSGDLRLEVSAAIRSCGKPWRKAVLTSADQARYRRFDDTDNSKDLESLLVVGDAVSKVPLRASMSLKPLTTNLALREGSH